jgi:two-component system, OmpR family, phosphate regulon sensor histidine kinase PhoR
MSNIWSTEAWAIAIAAYTLALIGLLSGEWFLASLITLVGYIAWLYQRLLKLERWIRKGTRTSEVYDDQGFVGIIIRQLYAQKKVSIQRKRRTKRIIRRLKQNIAALPDATVLLNRDLQIEWCNEPARHLLNLRSPEDLGYKINHLIRDPAFLAYLRNPAEKEYIEIESPVDQGVSIKIKLVVMGGNQSLLIARNISDQKQLQKSLKNFVANASHELKSPLTVISGHLEMLEAEDRLSDSGKHSLHTAQRQAERMKELVQGLLLLSQVESYSLAPNDGDRIAITELMINAMAALDKYADKDRVHLEYPENLFLLGVNIEIEGICINLLENALKYTTPGTAIRVRWEESERGEFVFSVEDEGPGIEAQDISKLTRRYYRGATSRAETSGSGLGLAIVQHAANKHGASFQIQSEPEKGSRFSVTFPSYRCGHEQHETARVHSLADF